MINSDIRRMIGMCCDRCKGYPCQCVRVYEDDYATLVCETTWSAFVEANEIDDEEAQELRETLRRDGRVWVGGGAAPLFCVSQA